MIEHRLAEVPAGADDAYAPSRPARPSVMATKGLVVSGHPWASQAGFEVLQRGGNAFDAGVAVGLAINVLESEMTCLAGVAPSMLYFADRDEVQNFVGVGPWPRAASAAYFREHHGGKIPSGVLSTVVPAAPDIWLTTLERFGTMSFGEVASAAIRFADEGFPMYPFMVEVLGAYSEGFRDLESTAEIFLPGGELPPVGELFRQRDLAATLTHLADEERAAGGSRVDGIAAARRAFYEGDIAAAIVEQQEANGGLMTREDLAGFRAEMEAPARARFGDFELYGCGPWSQGPMVLLAAQILDGLDLASMRHNGPDYVHAVAEALKLAAADREHYFGDPAEVDVPLDEIMSAAYAEQRRGNLDPSFAAPGMPLPGDIAGYEQPPWRPDPSSNQTAESLGLETSYLCVIDEAGNIFSATPSDPTVSGEVVPGTGITTSMWGTRGHTAEGHPARVGPGWRPRMSANPMMAREPGKRHVALGSPGSEVLGQAQLQAFLNLAVGGLDPQSAVEAPRFASYSWPASAIPHTYRPARLNLERPIGEAVGEALAGRGHEIEWWPEREWRAGSVSMIVADLVTGVRHAGADSRRSAYAVGW